MTSLKHHTSQSSGSQTTIENRRKHYAPKAGAQIDDMQPAGARRGADVQSADVKPTQMRPIDIEHMARARMAVTDMDMAHAQVASVMGTSETQASAMGNAVTGSGVTGRSGMGNAPRQTIGRTGDGAGDKSGENGSGYGENGKNGKNPGNGTPKKSSVGKIVIAVIVLIVAGIVVALSCGVFNDCANREVTVEITSTNAPATVSGSHGTAASHSQAADGIGREGAWRQ